MNEKTHAGNRQPPQRSTALPMATLSIFCRFAILSCLVFLGMLSEIHAQTPVGTDAAATIGQKTTSENGDETASEDRAAVDETSPDESGDTSPSASRPIADFIRTPPLGYLFQGGLFMWPILLMGIIGAGVIIERYRSLKMLEDHSGALRTKVGELLEQGDAIQAFQLCSEQQGPVPAVLSTGLRKYVVLQEMNYEPAHVEEQVVKSMDDYSVHIVAALERHLPILATISSAAPMLGFLGTVQGMIVAFDDIVLKMGETNIVEAAASGIKVSLMTTCFGLIVGIPAFVAYNYFTGVINRFVLDVEESATEMIETVTLAAAVKRADDRASSNSRHSSSGVEESLGSEPDGDEGIPS